MSAVGGSRVDPRSGSVFLSEAEFVVLRAAAEGGPPQGAAVERERLTAVGALVDGRPHQALARGLAAVAAPLVSLLLERGSRRGHGWVDGECASLLVPAPDGLLQLIIVPTMFLPDALARLNALGPRPRVAPAVRVRLGAGELARLIAARNRPAAHGAPARDEEVRRLVRGLREHWRVEARWPAAGGVGARVVEVLDTDSGLWLLTPDGGDVEVCSSTPTAVWRLLTALLPADDEIEPDAASRPART